MSCNVSGVQLLKSIFLIYIGAFNVMFKMQVEAWWILRWVKPIFRRLLKSPLIAVWLSYVFTCHYSAFWKMIYIYSYKTQIISKFLPADKSFQLVYAPIIFRRGISDCGRIHKFLAVLFWLNDIYSLWCFEISCLFLK